MQLDLVRAVRDFFSDLFGKFSLENLLILLSGVVIGFILCFLIYLVIVVSSFKKDEKNLIVSEILVDNEKIERLIRSAKNQFLEFDS
jgi:hypothetical protein